MRLALVSDIHGNLTALEAVVDELSRRSVDRVVCLGDVATSGPQPVETIARLKQLGWPVVMGNTDEWLLNPRPYTGDSEFYRIINALHQWCADQLSAADKAFIGSFQKTIHLELEPGYWLLAYHGTPASPSGWLNAQTADEDLERVIAFQDANLLAGGHTHQQMLRRFRDRLLVNPGSVGLAYEQARPEISNQNMPWAEYALVEIEAGRLGVELRRVPYDTEPVFAAARKSGMPHTEWWISKWRRA